MVKKKELLLAVGYTSVTGPIHSCCIWEIGPYGPTGRNCAFVDRPTKKSCYTVRGLQGPLLLEITVNCTLKNFSSFKVQDKGFGGSSYCLYMYTGAPADKPHYSQRLGEMNLSYKK